MTRMKLVTSHDIRKLRVVGGKKGTKKIGKVKACVFHPSERRCIGFVVKRPDLLWMFHRKDIFVGLGSFDFVDGRIRIKPDAVTSGAAACKAMGLDWDKCIIWEGLPMMTAEETAIGYVNNITFDIETGQVEAVEAHNGATAKLLLGTLEVPASYIEGFRRGMGADLAIKEDSREAGEEVVFKGAILVSDDVWELSPEGGWAEAAGKFSAKAGARAKEAAEAAKPKVEAAGAAVKEGAEGVGRQAKATKDAFGAFKEEFNKAKAGEETEVGEQVAEREAKTKGMFAAFKEEFDKAKAGEEDEVDVAEEELAADDAEFEEAAAAEAADDAYEDAVEDEILAEEDEAEIEEAADDEDADEDDFDDDEYEDDEDDEDDEDESDEDDSKSNPGIGGMFAAFKSEFDKAAKGE